MSFMTIEEMEKRAIKAENNAIKYAGMADSLRAKLEECEHERDVANDENYKWKSAFMKLWDAHVALVNATPIAERPKVARASFVPKEWSDEAQ